MLSGFFSVPVTPFSSDGSFSETAFATILEWHISNGADGLMIGADNGECSVISLEERRRMAKVAMAVAKGRVPVAMGAFSSQTLTANDTIPIVALAAEAGLAAVLVAPQPWVGTATRAEIVDRFKAIHKAVPLPMIAYNNPRHFGIAIEGDTLQALCDEVNIVGIKESSRDFLDVSRSIARFSDRLCFFMGCGYLIMPGLAAGAQGIMSTGLDLLGPRAGTVISAAKGAWTGETRKLHLQIANAYTFMLGKGTPPAAIKAALNMIGLPAGVPRLPTHPLGRDETAALQKLLVDIGALPQIGERKSA